MGVSRTAPAESHPRYIEPISKGSWDFNFYGNGDRSRFRSALLLPSAINVARNVYRCMNVSGDRLIRANPVAENYGERKETRL